MVEGREAAGREGSGDDVGGLSEPLTVAGRQITMAVA